tara:strand:- start:193 stop:831 length:639 start_codon:yes stop_codon:yes gene_type:complete
MPQLDFDGAASRISTDNIRGQSGSTITIVSGHNLVGSGSGLTSLPAANLTGTLPAISGANLTNLPAHSGNVAFPASQSASSNANTLDDYEEGNWTPALNAPGNATYTEQTGAYTKIGNVVNIWGTLTINAIGTASSSSLAGLPFTATANGGLFLTYSGSLAKNQYSYVTGQIVTGTTRVDMMEYDVTTGVSAMTAAQLSSGADLYFYGNYKA